MADVKWIKLSVDMFDNRKIKHLRRLPEGDSIVLIWVMLLALAGRCNANGLIFLTENIAYTSKMLADELDMEESTVQLALSSLERLGMISSEENGFLTITGWEEHQNIDGMEKIKESKRLAQARWRAKQKELPSDTSTVDSTVESTKISVDHAEEDIDIELDIDKNKKKNREEKKSESVGETSHATFQRLLPDYILSESVQEKMYEWIRYKIERRESYKEQGLKSLLHQVEVNTMKYGDAAVCNLIDECMANNWKGIIFERLQKSASSGNAGNGRLDWIDDI